MKHKPVAAALAALLLLALAVGCAPKVDPDSPFIGVWVCYEAEALGLTLDAADIYGEDVPTITFDEKGKAQLYFDQEYNGKWKETETGASMYDAGGEYPFTLADGVLTMESADTEGNIVILRFREAA